MDELKKQYMSDHPSYFAGSSFRDYCGPESAEMLYRILMEQVPPVGIQVYPNGSSSSTQQNYGLQ